jgi:Protein of unknown function (DUF2917)
METQSNHATYGLKTGRFVTFPDGHHVEIRCDAGGVWITQDNGVRDIHLAAGDRFVSNRAEALSVYAFQPTVLTSIAPHEWQVTKR